MNQIHAAIKQSTDGELIHDLRRERVDEYNMEPWLIREALARILTKLGPQTPSVMLFREQNVENKLEETCDATEEKSPEPEEREPVNDSSTEEYD